VNHELLEELATYSDDPVGFAHFAFPWDEVGSELEGEEGLNDFQLGVLTDLGAGLIDVAEAIQLCVTSGHGVGKSALVAIIMLWALGTYEDTKGVVTANTENQLKTKTWAELAKWFRMFIGKEFFRLTATALFSVEPEHEKTWRIDMVPWSERNTEAFAGLHNKGKRLILIFDEGSAIPDLIYEVSEGALTDKDTQIIWMVFGNPTRATGRFRACFPGGKFAHRWKSRKVDSRDVPQTNKHQITRWFKDYGEDHDFFRVRVRGEFPRVDADSFISTELVLEAVGRVVEQRTGEAVVLGVDVGRFGTDPSVIYPRKGRDASSLPVQLYMYIDTMDLANKIAAAYHQHKASFCFVDGGGVGGGVVDRLRQMRVPVIEVDFGARASGTNVIQTGVKYSRKRSEMWGAMRDWLPFGSLPEKINGLEHELVDELCEPRYGMDNKEAIRLESKGDIRRRGGINPNVADALACTFAFDDYMPSKQDRHDNLMEEKSVVVLGHDPYDLERMYS